MSSKGIVKLRLIMSNHYKYKYIYIYNRRVSFGFGAFYKALKVTQLALARWRFQ